MSKNVVVTGAAGFIGSHLIDRLLNDDVVVTGIDNLRRGSLDNLADASKDSRFRFISADLSIDAECERAFDVAGGYGPINLVWHMAANSDIAAGVEDASVDLRDTFLTSFNTLQAMRTRHIPVLVFASSSAVYGIHHRPISENSGPLFPISNYGAMKLASEGSITAAAESYLERAYIFRFPNVVGGRATHGVIFDLLTKLRRSPGELEVLGDGRQKKPYLHVSELLDAMLWVTAQSQERINCFNIAGLDAGVTVRYIAEKVVETAAPGTLIRYTGGTQGWVGDVPQFSYSTRKIAEIGWRSRMSSAQAIDRATREIHSQLNPCRS
jgi:UDP-glucose 4-epimerase